jgi:glutamate-ammonia-ligase adenylyltransferase
MADVDSPDIAAFINSLPDPRAARIFLERLGGWRRDPLLLARLLTLAAYSPFLSESLLRRPEYIDWLSRDLGRSKTSEQLSEELARFVTLVSGLDPATRLARFKNRELMRIYLRDCLHIATLAEVTEELSSLADVILGYALSLAHQEVANRHGSPLTRDAKGRVAQSEMAIVALGKLGCRELNYASDIDLMFLYAGEGETAGAGRGREGVVSNKEFFTTVAQWVVNMTGRNHGEGAVYRIDLRLRPYGRDGDLVWEAERAADYYRTRAHGWERQALIRARASAGSASVVTEFLESVRDRVFQTDALGEAISGVRQAKEKIDRQEARRAGGFNVKLGIGGIREIEFIAQALQLTHGGRQPWLRSAQTLIVLARLAEKGYLTEGERARLSAAYTFLRTVEHRLQMEHGAQTHRVPVDRAQLELLARRSGYSKAVDPASDFLADLERHTSAVRTVYNRVFSETAAQTESRSAPSEEIDDETGRLIRHAASALAALTSKDIADARVEISLAAETIASALESAINPHRSLRNLAQWAHSLATCDAAQSRPSIALLCGDHLREFIHRLMISMSSQHLAGILVSRPALASAIMTIGAQRTREDFLRLMRLDESQDAGARMDALRRAWYRLMVETGFRDLSAVSSQWRAASGQWPATGVDHLRENNLEQTALAEASLEMALRAAFTAMGIEDARTDELPFAILGLGRLGHAGMDYGSDIDLLVVFDDSGDWPPDELKEAARKFSSPQEFYSRLATWLVRALSSITREGFLYRVDLRLRPDGQSGPLAQGLASMIAYINDRASAWEHSAYLKAREVAGHRGFGQRAREAICQSIFDASARNPSLKEDLRVIRSRLEREKARSSRPDIKWGRGGMTDVYFVTRYLQLRDRIYYPPERGTLDLIRHLGARQSIATNDSRALFEGYAFLRRLDHWMRLLIDRPTPVLPASGAALLDLARALGLRSGEELERLLADNLSAIRRVYENVFA